MNLSKCKMMLDDLTRVTMTHSELLTHESGTLYTCEQITSVIEDIVLDVTHEHFKLNSAKLGTLQAVVAKQDHQYCLHSSMRHEISRLIKLHEELYNAESC
ncbi:hypothetical protein KASIA_p043 [Shewanella phage vB_SspS_KASIA]|nr:hypothetical protein KASIA_p043 [Shewanella phage vB_SspS_KASIA]